MLSTVDFRVPSLSGISPAWTDPSEELDTVLSTLQEMFGDLPSVSVSAPQIDFEEMFKLLDEVEALEPREDSASVLVDLDPLQCGAPTLVPSYRPVLLENTVGQYHPVPTAERWMDGGAPPGFWVQLPPMKAHPFMHGNTTFFNNQNVPLTSDPSPSLPQACASQCCCGKKPKPYVKRPPNAFMVFMRENRGMVKDTLRPKDSAETNTILGHMWRTLSSQDKNYYLQMANDERRIHAEKHPEWSACNNYGRKHKRERKKKNLII